MLEKATDEDVAGFQYYTLDNKKPTTSDIDQYKLMKIKEAPLDNRQKHLDVMCFPVLFPDGHYGEFHPREHQLSPSDYIKSRLCNVDSRFRRDPQYIFYLLAQKEKRELKAGIFRPRLHRDVFLQTADLSVLLGLPFTQTMGST